MRKSSIFTSVLTFLLVTFSALQIANAQNFTRTVKVGPDSVTLKVLPAESFKGPNAKMAWDDGAKPVLLSHSPAPNHHLVAFIKKGERPVEKANVKIRYRQLMPAKGEWKSLPVARMHVAGKGLATTHFGNNVNLKPGGYEVKVTVNNNAPALFLFKLKK